MRPESKLARKKVKIVEGTLKGYEILIEDWWENVGGCSWMNADGNPACIVYGMRAGSQEFHVPIDNEVLYGKLGGAGHLVHISELEKDPK